MEAPEKIYLTKNFLGELRDGWDALPSEVFTNVEYIRKDAFIEEVCKYLQKEVVEDYAGVVWEGLIEDIKKYMEDLL